MRSFELLRIVWQNFLGLCLDISPPRTRDGNGVKNTNRISEMNTILQTFAYY